MAVSFKLVLIGDPTVGKTTLRERFLEGSFKKDYLATIGADFALKELKLENFPIDKITLQIWDIAGQKTFDDVRTLYFRGGHGALVVFDVCNRDSALTLFKWINSFYQNNDNGPCPILVLANKIDLRGKESRCMSNAECERTVELLKEQINNKYRIDIPIDFIETSAKTGKGVDRSFGSLAENIYRFFEKRDNSTY